jgi:hypothetical protein
VLLVQNAESRSIALPISAAAAARNALQPVTTSMMKIVDVGAP